MAAVGQDRDRPAGLSDPALGRLRWRCRRGMKELDHLLLRWLEREWADADASARVAFSSLLEAEDDALWRWFTGQERPAAGAQRDLVDAIRADAGL